ncbi:MATE family efflux transporter [Neptunicella sp. SCSIO 80796]|uniref:MATE family efflux transporter n=1 Tax=Neptunicella plasticusilytica TaxID=3117012 RepID=UPI003A4E0ED8
MSTAAQQKGLWGMSRPLLVEQCLQFSVPVFDTFFLSRVSDTSAAAAGAMTPVLFFCANIMWVAVFSGASIASQRLGAGNQTRANATIATYAVWVIILAAILTAALYVATPYLTEAMGLPGQVQIDANIYLSIVCWLLLVLAFKALFQSILNIYGKPHWNMYANVVYFIANVLGNAIVVFGWFGFPKMGLVGVAWASVFGSLLGVLVSGIAVFMRLKLELKWRFFVAEFRPASRHIIRLGVPSMIEPLSFDINMIVLNSLAASLGAVALAAKIYTFNTFMLGLIISVALTTATEVLLTQKVGAGDYNEAKLQVRQSLKAALWGTGIVAFALLLLNHPIMNLFTDDAILLGSSFWLFLLAALSEPPRTANIMLARALRSTGDAWFISIVGPIFTWCIALPSAYIMAFVFNWGVYGILASAILDEGSRAVFYWFRWNKDRWHHTHVHAREQQKVVVET